MGIVWAHTGAIGLNGHVGNSWVLPWETKVSYVAVSNYVYNTTVIPVGPVVHCASKAVIKYMLHDHVHACPGGGAESQAREEESEETYLWPLRSHQVGYGLVHVCTTQSGCQHFEVCHRGSINCIIVGWVLVGKLHWRRSRNYPVLAMAQIYVMYGYHML